MEGWVFGAWGVVVVEVVVVGRGWDDKVGGGEGSLW